MSGQSEERPSRIAWAGESWRLRVETIRGSDGRLHEKGYLEHPGAVVLVPLQGESVLMLRQYRPALDDTILELPAGTRGWDEEWLVCAQRELREETGHRAETFTPLGRIWPAPGVSDELMAVYLATGLSPDGLEPDEDEQFEVTAVPLADLVAMALDGRLQDAKSVVGVLRTEAYLRR